MLGNGAQASPGRWYRRTVTAKVRYPRWRREVILCARSLWGAFQSELRWLSSWMTWMTVLAVLLTVSVSGACLPPAFLGISQRRVLLPYPVRSAGRGPLDNREKKGIRRKWGRPKTQAHTKPGVGSSANMSCSWGSESLIGILLKS